MGMFPLPLQSRAEWDTAEAIRLRSMGIVISAVSPLLPDVAGTPPTLVTEMARPLAAAAAAASSVADISGAAHSSTLSSIATSANTARSADFHNDQSSLHEVARKAAWRGVWLGLKFAEQMESLATNIRVGADFRASFSTLLLNPQQQAKVETAAQLAVNESLRIPFQEDERSESPFGQPHI
jgi:hypothetical protein